MQINKVYSTTDVKLICDEHGFYYYSMVSHSKTTLLVCNSKNNDVDLFIKYFSDSYLLRASNGVIEKSVSKQIAEDGSYWEGDWYNEQPFGYGSIFDSSGSRIYSGFMFEGKKVAYGVEYSTNSHVVEYCGNFTHVNLVCKG